MQVDSCEFKASVAYVASFRLSKDIWTDPILKRNIRLKKVLFCVVFEMGISSSSGWLSAPDPPSFLYSFEYWD